MSDKITTKEKVTLTLGSLALLTGLTVFSGLNSQNPLPFPQEFTPTTKEVVVENNHDSGVQWETVAEWVTDSVVSIAIQGEKSSGFGSGVILDSKGYVLTNAHVADSGEIEGNKLTVVLSDSSVFDAEVLEIDHLNDLAIIKIVNPPTGLVPIRFGDSEELTVGDPVMAVGSPLGLAGTVTTGIISALDRPVQPKGAQQATTTTSGVISALQTNAAINPGNSGGALVNERGELVGINTAIATDGQGLGSIGIGFAIPSATVERVKEYLIQGKEFPHGRMGLTVYPGTGKWDGSDFLGAAVSEVVDGSPAAIAGLRKDDVVVNFNDVRVAAQDTLVSLVNSYPAGSKVEIVYLRGGKTHTTTVTLGNGL